ncbi:hypothetical protein T10_12413 [Trichinella papuae]|uniref:Uncharacterized protein n=1 Tax=Trichinella papuae TaxID=268474 RepID=A0A0V1M217_9BILA|nr:hypothetical protein T10_12413 [Trichinella papuae]
MSRVCPGGKSSRRTASVIRRRALAAWCAGGMPLTRKKSSIVSSHSVGSISGEKAGGGPWQTTPAPLIASSRTGPHCNDPLGGVVWLASSGSAPVRLLLLFAGSSSLARSRLRVAIFHVRIVTALAQLFSTDGVKNEV